VKNMVIEQAGKATGNVISSAGQGFSYATEGIPWWGKLALIGGGVGIAGYLAYYTINQLTGPSGGSCTTPGSPCYNALQPYQEQFNECATQYNQYLQQYLQQDSANGTGLTTGQQDNLNYLTQCMNTAAGNIGKVAKQYEPENVVDILATDIGIAIIIVGASIGAGYLFKKIYPTLKNNKPITGSDFANGSMQTQLRMGVDDGTITPDQAANLKQQLPNISQNDISTNTDTLNQMVADDVLTQDEADTLATEDEANIDADTTDTIDDFLGE
jgi:hypothetical protein